LIAVLNHHKHDSLGLPITKAYAVEILSRWIHSGLGTIDEVVAFVPPIIAVPVGVNNDALVQIQAQVTKALDEVEVLRVCANDVLDSQHKDSVEYQ